MAHSYKIVGVIALAAAAACSIDATSPDLKATARARADLTAASTNNVVVTESDITRQFEDTPPTDNWVFYTKLSTTSGAFVSGPGNPPLGVGSFEMRTPTSDDHGTLFNFDHANTPLASITAISYATYRDPSSTSPLIQLPAINIQVDKNGGAFEPGDFLSLVFEPAYNPDQGIVQSGVWQSWHGIDGKWWATRLVVLADGTECPRAACYLPWSVWLAAMPNATIVGGFGVNQGTGSGGLVGATDALRIGHNENTWTYNFEPFRSKKDCKKDGRNDAKGDDGSSPRDDGKCKKDKKDKNGNSDED
jgi:hypothetical protein